MLESIGAPSTISPQIDGCFPWSARKPKGWRGRRRRRRGETGDRMKKESESVKESAGESKLKWEAVGGRGRRMGG